MSTYKKIRGPMLLIRVSFFIKEIHSFIKQGCIKWSKVTVKTVTILFQINQVCNFLLKYFKSTKILDSLTDFKYFLISKYTH